ncbi:hypothetical protein NC652_007228 [Populus alba x Populus x berolinensis]|nr:hypothetical protein NC652_007228 [Populus alba x Populus x berolinensis]
MAGRSAPLKFGFSAPSPFLGCLLGGFCGSQKGKVCGSGDVQVASMWEKEGVGLRVLKNGDGEGSPFLVLGVGEKEREMGPREEL